MDVATIGLTHAHMGAAAADDGREGVDDGDARHDQRHDNGGEAGDARDREQRDRGEGEAQKQRPRVAKENRGGVEVVAQEAEGRASERDGQRGSVHLSAQQREHKQGHAGDEGDARREPVQAIDEIEDVGVGHQIDDGDRIGEPAHVKEVRRVKRVDHVTDDQPAGNCHAGGSQLADQLLLGRERDAVVHHSREEDNHKGDAQKRVVNVAQVRRGRERHGPAKIVRAHVANHEQGHDAHEDGDSAHARDGLAVDATIARVVDGVHLPGDGAGDRRHEQRHHKRHHKEAQVGHPLLSHVCLRLPTPPDACHNATSYDCFRSERASQDWYSQGAHV